MKKFSLVIDQSTSGTKVLLYDGEELKRVDKKHEQLYPQPGWVEHNPIEIYNNVIELINQILELNNLDYKDIKKLSITNQRETIVAWDKKTGIPVTNALVWQCNRAIQECDTLIKEGKEALIREKTGLNIDTYFSAPKIKWLKKNIPEFTILMENKSLCIGTIDTWLIWNLTEKKVFATDESNASRTMLYNIKDRSWDKDLLELFEVEPECLPDVLASDATYGFYKGIEIKGVLADSQASLFANDCFEPGSAKATLGTGCSIMVNTNKSETSIYPTLVETIAWNVKSRTNYAVEGVIRSMGDTLEWVKNDLKLISDVKDIQTSSLDSHGVIFIPAQLGMATPYWNTKINASFSGMTRSSTHQDMVNAVYLGLIFQIKDVIEEINLRTTTPVISLKVDGGISKNSVFVQYLSNVLGIKVYVNVNEELSAIGALKAAGHAYKTESIEYTPKEKNQYANEFIEWKHAITSLIKQGY